MHNIDCSIGQLCSCKERIASKLCWPVPVEIILARKLNQKSHDTTQFHRSDWLVVATRDRVVSEVIVTRREKKIPHNVTCFSMADYISVDDPKVRVFYSICYRGLLGPRLYSKGRMVAPLLCSFFICHDVGLANH